VDVYGEPRRLARVVDAVVFVILLTLLTLFARIGQFRLGICFLGSARHT